MAGVLQITLPFILGDTSLTLLVLVNVTGKMGTETLDQLLTLWSNFLHNSTEDWSWNIKTKHKKHELVLCDKLCLVSYTRFHRSINTILCDLTELCACERVMRFGLELEMKVVTLVGAYARQHTHRQIACLPQRRFRTFLVVSWCASRFRVPEAIYIYMCI